MESWLYIVLLGAVVLVFATLKPGKRTEAVPGTTMKDIEATMDQFTAELEEENRQLLELVSEMKHDHEKHTAKLQGRLEALERQNLDVTKQLDRLLQAEAQARVQEAAVQQTATSAAPLADKLSAAATGGSAVPAVQPIPAQPETDAEPAGGMNIRSRYADLFRLEKQGKSIDHIAKKLGMNKGEVMLILQLAKQEDGARA